jgi:signal transduction histidine kinase
MVVSGLAALRVLNAMHQEEESAHHLWAQRAQNLTGLCVSIQLYSETAQQYVDRGKSAERDLRARLARLQSDIDSGFRSLARDSQHDDTVSLETIQRLFVRQRELWESMLALSEAERRRRAPQIMIELIEPLQIEILERSDQLRIRNGEQSRGSDLVLLAQFARYQGLLTRSLVLALGSGFLLVLASMFYILRLERQTRFRYAEVMRSRGELERLSGRLVDVQETERRNLSRELHDEVGQTLGALLMDFGRLSAAIPPDPPDLKEQVERMKSVAERAVRTVRNMALLLRPSMLDDLGLVPALEWQGREVSRNSRMEVEVQSEGVSEELPDEYKVCIYRLVQEALNNAVRHSGARNARVRVEQAGGRITVEVSDDGRGFDPERSRGMGILGMEERVKRLGGSLAIDSRPGQGTTLRAELPVKGDGGPS